MLQVLELIGAERVPLLQHMKRLTCEHCWIFDKNVSSESIFNDLIEERSLQSPTITYVKLPPFAHLGFGDLAQYPDSKL